MLTLANANRAGQRHDLDRPCASPTKCGRRGVDRCTGRVDVVDQHHASGNATVRKKGVRDVPAPVVLCQPPLAWRPSRSRQQRPERELPLGGELARQPLRRVVSTLQPAVRIARDGHDTSGVRLGHRLADDRRCPAGEPPQATLLPGAHDRAKAVVVRQHGAGTSEGEPATGALSTTVDRPGRWRTAPLAQRRLDTAKGRGTTVANLCSRKRADEAALRQKQIEHVITLGQRV